jgi:cytochrome P450
MVAVQFNPFVPEVHANPYPMYHALREQDAVHWSELMEAWVLTRYEDVASVLRDPALLSRSSTRFSTRPNERAKWMSSGTWDIRCP